MAETTAARDAITAGWPSPDETGLAFGGAGGGEGNKCYCCFPIAVEIKFHYYDH